MDSGLQSTSGATLEKKDDAPPTPTTSAADAPITLTATPDIPVSPNPWDDVPAPTLSSDKDISTTLTTLEPLALESPGFGGLKSSTPPSATTGVITKEILSEFDPLEEYEEKAAREAWGAAESHPPPPRTPSPPVPPLKDLYISSPTSPEQRLPDDKVPVASANPITSPSSFPSFGAFARAFSIPLAKPRPLSLDGAASKAAPSPTTSTSFAAQQDGPKSDSGKGPASGRSTPNRPGSGTASPGGKSSEGGFDFQKFLDQMKTKSADPVSKYLRSFLSNFAKRTFTVSDQVKIINDFLNFIAAQMRECEVWRNSSDSDFENAMEGMEKLVMNRLYEFTFTPQLAQCIPPRPITTDDLERDRVLSQRISLFGWLEEMHLDIPEGEGSKGFLMFAQQELLKINHYKAPRDKLICILNCCKVIFGLLRHLHKEEGADMFVPILIYIVVKANPEHLLSNVEFINRFRNPAKLQSEAGYYLSSLMGAVQFIETMDHSSLSNITQEEFEKNVEEAIRTLPPSEPHSPAMAFAEVRRGIPSVISPHAGEESAQPLSLSTPAQTLSDDAKRLLQKTGDTISKPLNALGRIFSEALDGAENKLSYLPGPFAPFELGRENREQQQAQPGSATGSQWPSSGQSTPRSAVPQTPYGTDAPYNPIQTPYKARVKRVPSPSFNPSSPYSPGSPGFGPEDTPSRMGPHTHQALAMGPSSPMPPNSLLPPRVQTLSSSEGGHISRTPTPALDFAAVEAQMDASHAQAAIANRDTLRQIFPTVDLEVVDWVLEANGGDMGRSIEGLLEMSDNS